MPPKIHHGYEELPQEQIDDPDGPRAIFSRRSGSPPLFTVAFFKTFRAADDQVAQTSFFTLKSIQGLRRVIDLAEKRLQELAAGADESRRTAPSQSPDRR